VAVSSTLPSRTSDVLQALDPTIYNNLALPFQLREAHPGFPRALGEQCCQRCKSFRVHPPPIGSVSANVLDGDQLDLRQCPQRCQLTASPCESEVEVIYQARRPAIEKIPSLLASVSKTEL
jgi:hypothetical protein